jgi:hypothetical protein
VFNSDLKSDIDHSRTYSLLKIRGSWAEIEDPQLQDTLGLAKRSYDVTGSSLLLLGLISLIASCFRCKNLRLNLMTTVVNTNLFYSDCVGSYKLNIQTFSNLFLKPTSTKQWFVKFLAQGKNVLPLSAFEPTRPSKLRSLVRHVTQYATPPLFIIYVNGISIIGRINE